MDSYHFGGSYTYAKIATYIHILWECQVNLMALVVLLQIWRLTIT